MNRCRRRNVVGLAPVQLGAVPPIVLHPDPAQDRDRGHLAQPRRGVRVIDGREQPPAIVPDGWRLLAAIDHAEAPPWLREVPAVALLRRVSLHNYWWDGAQLHWREADNIPPAARFISAPYDAEAHYARKHTTQWVGYKVRLTETCEDDLPHLITHVETTTGPAADGATTPKIHAALQQRGLLPGTHIVDTGVLDAELFVQSRDDDGVDLLGPTRLDSHGQARAGAGFDAQHFPIDGDQQHATCPAGKTSLSWTPAIDHREHAVIKVTVLNQGLPALRPRDARYPREEARSPDGR